jgi:hypothetical protein
VIETSHFDETAQASALFHKIKNISGEVIALENGADAYF